MRVYAAVVWKRVASVFTEAVQKKNFLCFFNADKKTICLYLRKIFIIWLQVWDDYFESLTSSNIISEAPQLDHVRNNILHKVNRKINIWWHEIDTLLLFHL